MPTKEELSYLQSLPLEIKILMTKARIREWVSHYGEEGVYVSFSGGKDSTVLLRLVREEYPNIEAVFVNTGLEYPEIQKFVKSFENVTILRPKMSFVEVIKKYGYPIVSKEVAECIGGAKKAEKQGIINQRIKQMNGDWTDKTGKKSQFNYENYKPLMYVDFKISNKCCNVMKKSPSQSYAKKMGKAQMTAQMADESRLRKQTWLQNGCNGFDLKLPTSNPMSFWTEQDVLQYISQNDIPIASVYGEIIPDTFNDGQMAIDNSLVDLKCSGFDRTGCIFCGFAAHLDKGLSRFERLKRTHPKQYEYCLGGGEYNEEGLWQPNEKGLGMKHVFDVFNELYPNTPIRY